MNNVQAEIKEFIASGVQTTSLTSHYREIQDHCDNSSHWVPCVRGYFNPELGLVITKALNKPYRIGWD